MSDLCVKFSLSRGSVTYYITWGLNQFRSQLMTIFQHFLTRPETVWDGEKWNISVHSINSNLIMSKTTESFAVRGEESCTMSANYIKVEWIDLAARFAKYGILILPIFVLFFAVYNVQDVTHSVFHCNVKKIMISLYRFYKYHNLLIQF